MKESDNIIKVLAIGNERFVKRLSDYISSDLGKEFTFETITDESKALPRLNHNSYDILILQDGFSKYDTVRLSTMAYAMSRPTIILCSNVFKLIYYRFVKHFSHFFRNFKVSKKLIHFRKIGTKYSSLILELSCRI